MKPGDLVRCTYTGARLWDIPGGISHDPAALWIGDVCLVLAKVPAFADFAMVIVSRTSRVGWVSRWVMSDTEHAGGE